MDISDDVNLTIKEKKGAPLFSITCMYLLFDTSAHSSDASICLLCASNVHPMSPTCQPHHKYKMQSANGTKMPSNNAVSKAGVGKSLSQHLCAYRK